MREAIRGFPRVTEIVTNKVFEFFGKRLETVLAGCIIAQIKLCVQELADC